MTKQHAAEENLTLHDVAKMVVRESADVPSELERIREAAENLAQVWSKHIYLMYNVVVEILCRCTYMQIVVLCIM